MPSSLVAGVGKVGQHYQQQLQAVSAASAQGTWLGVPSLTVG